MISATPASDLTPPPPLPPPQVVAVTAQAPAAAPAAPPPPRPPRPGEAAGLDRSMGTIVIYESAVRAGRGCLVGMTRHARQGGSGSGAPARQHCRTLLANAPCFPACLACQCTSQRILLYGLLACQRTAVSSALPLPPSHPAGGCAQDADKLPTWLIVLMCMIALGAQSIFFVTIYRLRKIRKAKQAAAAARAAAAAAAAAAEAEAAEEGKAPGGDGECIGGGELDTQSSGLDIKDSGALDAAASGKLDGSCHAGGGRAQQQQ